MVLRLDGCHFHSFTRGFKKPFDPVMMKTMQMTMKYLCESIQGCVFGYTQSDEITLVLVDYKKLNSSAWFDNEVQKMCSVAASMCTMVFNRYFAYNVNEDGGVVIEDNVWNAYMNAIRTGAYFDCRAFNVPKEDVANNILWRQNDATRNSIEALAQANFSHKSLQGLNCNQLQDKLFLEKGINWNDLDVTKKRGCACFRVESLDKDEKTGTMIGRSKWIIDEEMPILTQDRDYVERFVFVGD